jgi:hypothetical protein
MEIPSGTEYTIQDQEEARWANDPDVLRDLLSGTATIRMDGLTLTGNEAINLLKDVQAMDSDQTPMVRLKINRAGWTLHRRSFVIHTGSSQVYFNHCHKAAPFGNAAPFGDVVVTVKDASGNVLTDPAEQAAFGVRSEVLIDPNFELEVIAGALAARPAPDNPMPCWIVFAPNIPAAYGGEKVVISGEDLSVENVVSFDGRTAKYLPNNPSIANQILFVLQYLPGQPVRIKASMEMFKL